jgi:hypothetical protein
LGQVQPIGPQQPINRPSYRLPPSRSLPLGPTLSWTHLALSSRAADMRGLLVKPPLRMRRMLIGVARYPSPPCLGRCGQPNPPPPARASCRQTPPPHLPSPLHCYKRLSHRCRPIFCLGLPPLAKSVHKGLHITVDLLSALRWPESLSSHRHLGHRGQHLPRPVSIVHAPFFFTLVHV